MSQVGTDAARTPTKGAIRLFLRYAQRFSQHTQRRYKDALYRFLADMPVFLDDITAEHIDIHLHKLKVSNNSKNTYLVAIRSFYRYLHDYHNLPNVAAKVKNLRSEPPKQVVISYIQLSQILAAASEKEYAVITFLANSGIRAQEFCDLTANSISPDKKFIQVIGKNRKKRTVPMNETCRQAWPHIYYKKWNRDKLAWLCKKLARKSGVEFSAHSLRHYFVTELIKKGVPISIVSKIVGHASPEITYKIYCHLTTPDTLGVTDCLD